MFLEIIIAILLGVASGIFTGLIPGIHVNLIAVITLTLAATLIPLFGIGTVVVFIIALAVTHSFISVVPSVFLGAPDAAMALSVLPGHKLLHEGRGIEAVRLTQIGSLIAVILSTTLFVAFVFVIQEIEPYLAFVPYVLLGLIVFLLLQDFKLRTVVLFLCSGVLGMLTFRLPGLENPLFPLLTGLFGISTLLLSLENAQIPEQKVGSFTIQNKELAETTIAGQTVGFIAAFMPGLGAASAAALAEPFVKTKEEGFLLLIGIISTVNFILSLATFYVLDKARNGAIVTIKELIEPSFSLVLLGIGSVILAGGLASLILTKIPQLCLGLMRRVDYVQLAKYIVCMLIVLTYILSDFKGFLILIPAVALGVLAPQIGVPRRFLMGCLLVPVLSYTL